MVTDHLRIHRVTMYEVGKEPSPDAIFGGNDEAPVYSGPNFEELDDALQVRVTGAGGSRGDREVPAPTSSPNYPKQRYVGDSGSSPRAPLHRTRSTSTWRTAACTTSWRRRCRTMRGACRLKRRDHPLGRLY
jgi:hypothetical protein